MIPLAQRLSTEIQVLLESLNESNQDSITSQLSQFVDYGTEGNILLLMKCLNHFNVYQNDSTSTHLRHVVAPIFRKLLEKPQFSTVFLMSVRPTAVTEEFLVNLSVTFELTANEKLGFGLALTDSENNDIRTAGRNFCMTQIEELCVTHASLDTTDYVQDVLLFLNKSEVLSKHVDSFMQLLSLVQLNKDSRFILAPVLSDEFNDSNLLRYMDFLDEENEDEFDDILAEMEREMNMADLFKELGYNCTLDASLCKDLLSSFSPLTELTVAKILGTVIQNDNRLQDHENAFSTFCFATGRGVLPDMSSLNSWNTDVLIESIKQLAPGINWTGVIENLDHEGFYVPDEAAFSLLISCYRHATQDPFPLAAVCGNVWRNIEGQLSFLKYAVSVPPEVFTFAHCRNQLANVDAVNSHKSQSGHANHAWLCLDLLEVLCQLAEKGLTKSVTSLLEYPLKHCPEVLLFGMAHVNTPYNILQHEVALAVVPVILKDAHVSGVLVHLWHVNPSFLLRALNDAVNMDSDNITRVFDICHELKIISPVLDMVPMSLGIRLASLASQKALIDLEKWLTSNLTTYKDSFFEECIRFLKEVDFGTLESSNRLHNPGNIWSLYMETAPVFLKVLQAHTNLHSSNQLLKEMERLHLTFKNNSSRMRNNGGLDSSTPEVYADDIEAEVNSYFQQMFSTQLTVDAVIQMLTRFKGSFEKREQSIFECMIANLLEEYKFFNRYPDQQLQIAAVLFGLLIKNQLVTHLTLGIALRAVLDALRKPPDSKIFVFGTMALEKFIDRLTEWPQYCQHILQISHLRGTHPELVTFIDRILSRNSSDTVYNPAADQQPTSILQPNTDVHTRSIPNYMKPNLTTTGQVSVPHSNEPVNIPKPQSVVSSPAALGSTPAFARPSRAGTSTRFGFALNIETLVAAAELRETPIEAPPTETQDKISFIINNLSASNFESKAKEFTEILEEQYHPWFAQYMVMKRASIEPNFHDLYAKFLDKVNSKPLNMEILKATYENCKVLLGSELIKSSSEERSLLKNLGGWLGKITISRNQCLRYDHIDPKSLIIEAYQKGLMIAVIPFSSKILESCSISLAYQPPNAWTMGILQLLAEIYAMPNLKMNLKFEIEVLFKNLSVDLKEVTPSSHLKNKMREVEGNPDFSNKDIGLAQQPIVGEVKPNMIFAPNQVELPFEVDNSSHSSGHSRTFPQYAAPHHPPTATLGLSDKLPIAQGFLQTQLPFPVGQLPSLSMDQEVIFNPKLQTLGLYMHFKSVLGISMEQAIKETVSSIVHRSVLIATRTTKEIVLKDYAMELDESRIRNAAHLMVASLAGSLAHVTCKEPLRGSISCHLRNNLHARVNIPSDLLEHTVQLVTNDNLDLGCAFIEQAATEKAVQTIDSELAPQLLVRRKHRERVGPAFFDTSMYTQGYVDVLPEALRPKPGHLSLSQQRIYEDFVRLPWQNQSNQNLNSAPHGPAPPPGGGSLHHGYGSGSGPLNPGVISSGISNVAHSMDSDGTKPSGSSVHSMVGGGMGPHNIEAVLSSVSAPELHIPESSGVSKEMGVLSQPLLSPSPSPSDHIISTTAEPSLITKDAVDKDQFISEEASNHPVESRDNTSVLESSELDPAAFIELVSKLFAEWYNIYEHSVNDQLVARFVLHLQQNGLLKADDTSDRFFHRLLDIAVSHCISSEDVRSNQQTQTLSFLAIDMFASLVFSILKFSSDHVISKLSLFSKVLEVTVRFIQKDAEDKKISFNPRPYFRLFIVWLLDLSTLEPVLEGSNFQVLTALATSLHALQPLKVPAFSFVWLELVSHKSFMPKLLTGPAQKGWPYFQCLLLDLFQFIEPFLRNAEPTEPIRFLYKGTLRVLLVLLHDFPEFLCEYHFSFCDIIPPSCIQMRNIVLSAFPRNMKLPDPSTPNLKIDLLAEISQSPRILSEVDAALKDKQMKNDVDEYIKTRSPGTSFLSELKQKLLLSPSETAKAGTRYNVPLMNSLVLYVGIQAIQQQEARTPHGQSMVSKVFLVGAALDIFQTLILELDTEGCYLFLNAIANQLRYPNNHTHYFSFILLFLFSESNQEVIQEQITRVLLERLVVNRPHPWGLLITFIELIKNPRYKFWNRSFTRCDPEIERLFESVSRSCGRLKPMDDGAVAG